MGVWQVNYDGNGAEGVEWALLQDDPPSLAVRFLDAFNERVAAAFWIRTNWPSTAVGRSGATSGLYQERPNVGSEPLHTSAAGFWATQQAKLGAAGLGPGLLGFFGDPTISWAAFDLGPTPLTVSADAFRRKWEREIWSTTAPGSAGQVAVFRVYLGTPFTQMPRGTTFLWSFPTVLTPEPERKHAGKIFRHDGSAWVLSADQTLRPDVGSADGHPEPGDLFGPWICADVREQLHRASETFYTETPLFTGSGSPDPHWFYSRISICEGGDSYANTGAGGTLEEAEDDFTGGGNVRVCPADYKFYDTLFIPVAIASILPGQPVLLSRTRWKVFSDRLPDPPPGGRSRLARGYAWAVITPFGLGINHLFDSFGDGVEEDRWEGVGASETSGGSFSSELRGSLDVPTGGVQAETLPTLRLRGYSGRIGIWQKWDVENGFQYSPVSG